jgi:hypothetical protein
VRKLTLLLAGIVAAVSLVGAGTAAAADKPAGSGLIDAVAAKLGVTPDKLQAAFKAVLYERIDRAVADKRLTPEQAAKLKERIAQGQGLGLGARKAFKERAAKLRQRIVERGTKLGPAAKYLGFETNAKLRAELAKGTSLAKIAQDRGKTVAGLVQEMVAPAKQRLDAAVTAKRLTQERADAILKRLTERVTKLVNTSFPVKSA